MTQQNQNPEKTPEQGERTEITKAELGPVEVDAKAEDPVDSSGQIVLEESDFPTEVTPERIVLPRSGFGGEKEITAAEKAEKRAARKFSKFVNAHLTGETDVDGFKISSFSLDIKGQLMPVDSVEFSSGNIRGSDDPRYPDDAGNVRILEINMSTTNDNSSVIRHDRLNGFVEINPDSHTNYPIAPEQVIEVIDILEAAEEEGRLTPKAVVSPSVDSQ